MSNHITKRKVRFVRIRGRVIPIRSKNKKAIKDITASKNIGSLAKIAGVTTLGLAGLFGAGKLQRQSDKLLKLGEFGKSTTVNKAAKIAKFTSRAVPAFLVGSALLAIDRKSRDEGTAFDIGNKSGTFNLASSLAGAFAFSRVGKRFEKFGLRGGKFPLKLRDI